MPRPRRTSAAVAEALVAVAPLATRWIERLLAGHDPPLTVPQYLALRAIARENVSGAELARRAGVSGAAVSQLLTGLEEVGLLGRSPYPGDRRRRSLTLSAAGEHARRSAEGLLREEIGVLFGDVPAPEADALAHLLPRVESVLSGAHPPRRPPGPSPRPPRGPRKI